MLRKYIESTLNGLTCSYSEGFPARPLSDTSQYCAGVRLDNSALQLNFGLYCAVRLPWPRVIMLIQTSKLRDETTDLDMMNVTS